MNKQDYYSVKQITSNFDVSRSFLYTLFNKKKLTPHKVQKKIFVNINEFQDLIAKNKKT